MVERGLTTVPEGYGLHGLSIPSSEEIKPGLVTAAERTIVRSETRLPMLAALVLGLVPLLKKYHQKIEQRVIREEMEALYEELENKGLLGAHPLITIKHLRERVAKSRGSIGGSLFGFSGTFDSISQPESNVLIAWKSHQGAGEIIISEVNLKQMGIVIEEGAIPTVQFEFNAASLLSQPMYAGGAVVRNAYSHPNGYIPHLAHLTIIAPNKEALNEYLLPANIRQPNRRSRL